MELADILRHSGPPRTEYFLDIPSRYGKLRLDLHSPVEVALSQTNMTEQMQASVELGIEEATALSEAANNQAAVDKLLALAGEFPYSAAIYRALASIYVATGNGEEAEYNFKQSIALRPDYNNLMLFARYLGSTGRLSEARDIEDRLWQSRDEVAANLSLEAVQDYLVTLSRVPDGPKMIEVAGEAVEEYGRETTLVYQQIYGYILGGREVEALSLLNSVLPRLSAEDPLQPRFQQMLGYLRASLLGG